MPPKPLLSCIISRKVEQCEEKPNMTKKQLICNIKYDHDDQKTITNKTTRQIKRKEIGYLLLNLYIDEINKLNNPPKNYTKEDFTFIESGGTYVFSYGEKFLKFVILDKDAISKNTYINTLNILKDLTTYKTILECIDEQIYAFTEPAFTSDLYDYMDKIIRHETLNDTEKQTKYEDIEEKLNDLLNKLANLSYFCYDLKSENIFIKLNKTEKNTEEISEMIIGDLDPRFCCNKEKQCDELNKQDYLNIIKLCLYCQSNGILFKKDVMTLNLYNIQKLIKLNISHIENMRYDGVSEEKLNAHKIITLLKESENQHLNKLIDTLINIFHVWLTYMTNQKDTYNLYTLIQ